MEYDDEDLIQFSNTSSNREEVGHDNGTNVSKILKKYGQSFRSLEKRTNMKNYKWL